MDVQLGTDTRRDNTERRGLRADDVGGKQTRPREDVECECAGSDKGRGDSSAVSGRREISIETMLNSNLRCPFLLLPCHVRLLRGRLPSFIVMTAFFVFILSFPLSWSPSSWSSPASVVIPPTPPSFSLLPSIVDPSLLSSVTPQRIQRTRSPRPSRDDGAAVRRRVEDLHATMGRQTQTRLASSDVSPFLL